MEHPKSDKHQHHHHILPDKVAFAVGGTLLFFTLVTVWVAGIDLGAMNFVVAMVVATIKALLVCLFFMNLLYDRRENSVIFGTSFLFLAVFIVLTATDLFFRGDVYVKGPLTAAAAPGGKSKFKKPWIGTPELVAHGKELFQTQCVACHGPEGKGNGPAAASLNPPPRNFTQTAGWKNGRKPSQIFKTLRDGVPGSAMSSFATLPADDRWALVHFVESLGPSVETDTPADLAKIGIDPTKDTGGGGEEAPSIPVKLAMARIAEAEAGQPPHGMHAQMMAPQAGGSPGAMIYRARCLQCHGENGQGGVKVQNMGVNPRAEVVTQPLTSKLEGMRSFDAFQRVVVRGLPGSLMPGNGQLSGAELHELYNFLSSHGGR